MTDRTTSSRRIHGYSAGATVVVLGPADQELLAALSAICGTTPEQVDGAPADVLGTLAAGASADPDRPLVVVDGSLRVSLPALLDVLDRPGTGTAALTVPGAEVQDGRDQVAVARIGRDGRTIEAASSPWHEVSAPTHALAGLLRVSREQRQDAARLWADAVSWAAGASARSGDVGGLLDLATVSLVRGGLPVRSSVLGPFTWSRGPAGAAGVAGDPWRQRLRGASRGGDGFFSTYAVRPLSRRLTAVGLRSGWSPNAVTVASLSTGVVAALLVATGNRLAWVAATILLMLALVIDCVDGEIARYTRRLSALGAWLDGVGDRVKEYSVFAALAVVAGRQGEPSWWLAIAAMALVTARHLEDYAYERRLAPSRVSRPARMSLADHADGGSGSTGLAGRRTTRDSAVYWAKKVVHMPIAERYLLISLGLLVFDPRLVLWTIVVTVTLALLWTQGGRTARVLLGHDPTWAAVTRCMGRDHLDQQLGLGPMASFVGRVATAPPLVGVLAPLLGLGSALLLASGRPALALVLLLVAIVLTGAGLRPPLHHQLAWQAPALLWAVEVLLVVAVLRATGASGAAAFAWLCAIAYHRYDVVYRLRDTGSGAAAWTGLLDLGVDGRMVLLVVVAWLAPDAMTTVLAVGAIVLAVAYLVESGGAWRRWLADRPVGPVGLRPVPAGGGS